MFKAETVLIACLTRYLLQNENVRVGPKYAEITLYVSIISHDFIVYPIKRDQARYFTHYPNHVWLYLYRN